MSWERVDRMLMMVSLKSTCALLGAGLKPDSRRLRMSANDEMVALKMTNEMATNNINESAERKIVCFMKRLSCVHYTAMMAIS